MDNKELIKNTMAVIPDFPKKGISFKDITPIFAKPEVFKITINEMINTIKDKQFDCIAGIESRGFWFGVPIAQALNLPFIPIRKKGKLPRPTVEVTYDLEYGKDTLTVHKDDIKPGSKVLVIDDVVATGGTLVAVKQMMEKLGAKCDDVLVLGYLKDLESSLTKLKEKGLNVHWLIQL